MSDTPDRLLRRPPRTLPTLALAVIVGSIGGLGIWILGHRIINDVWPRHVADLLSSIGVTPADSAGMVATAVMLVVMGVVFLLSALLPGDLTRRTVMGDETPGQTAITRRDLARSVRSRVARVDGVDSVTVSLRRSRLDVHVQTPVDDTDTVLRRSRRAVDGVIDELNPEKNLTPRVRVSAQR